MATSGKKVSKATQVEADPNVSIEETDTAAPVQAEEEARQPAQKSNAPKSEDYRVIADGTIRVGDGDWLAAGEPLPAKIEVVTLIERGQVELTEGAS
jgi:hypothetical protein